MGIQKSPVLVTTDTSKNIHLAAISELARPDVTC